MKTLNEQLVDYYNSMVNMGSPVDLAWLKRQRIVTGRQFLNVRFGSATVDSILGEKSYLAKAEDIILPYLYANDPYYHKLPELATLLALECKTMLEKENPVFQKYSSLDSNIAIPIFKFLKKSISFLESFSATTMQISIQQLNEVNAFISPEIFENNCNLYLFCEYLQESAFYVLEIAFEEIKEEVQKKTQ